MSDSNQAGESSKAATSPHNDGPDYRSKYKKNWELNPKSLEIYKVKEKVYVKGARGVDPEPYEIYEILGDGQYKLWRDGKSDGEVYRQENFQSKP